MKVENYEKLKVAFEMMNKAKSVYLIQEYVVGTMHSIDLAIINNEIRLFCPMKKGHYVGGMQSGTPNLSFVLQSTDPVYQQMLQYARDVVKALGDTPDSWANIEVFYTEKKEIVFCEIKAS